MMKNLLTYVLAACVLLSGGLGCAYTSAKRWEDGKKVAAYRAFGVFRNDIAISATKTTTKVGVNRPGLSDNGLEAIKVAPSLANEIGHTIVGTQAVDSLAEGIRAKAEARLMEKALEAGAK
jgi:hypothetical protein